MVCAEQLFSPVRLGRDRDADRGKLQRGSRSSTGLSGSYRIRKFLAGHRCFGEPASLFTILRICCNGARRLKHCVSCIHTSVKK